MKTSAAGRASIERREGRRLTAYRDTKGIWTIGVGHTGRMSPPKVTVGMTIAASECDAMLAADLAPVEAVINAAVKVPVSQNEFDAMASLGFNIGAAGLRTSSVIKRLNLGDVAGAAQAFMLWDHPAVLEGRRAEERTQFLTPDPLGPSGLDRAHAVATARARSLSARAVKLTDDANAVKTVGVAAAFVGAAGSVVSAYAHLAHVALVVAVLVVAGIAVDVLVVRSRRSVAATLSGHARGQKVAVDSGPAIAPVAVVKS